MIDESWIAPLCIGEGARSPLAHIMNAKTPTLLTHGEMDIDVPITQSEELSSRYAGSMCLRHLCGIHERVTASPSHCTYMTDSCAMWGGLIAI